MEWSFVFFLNSALLGVGLAMDAFSVSIANGLHDSGRCQTEAPHDKDDAEHDTPHQTTRMQNIRPRRPNGHRPPGIEPDQSDQESRIDCERHAERSNTSTCSTVQTT